MYKASASGQWNNKNFSTQFQACLYHVPFVKMAQKAHQKLLETDAGYEFAKDSV
jgi:3-hydroxy-3-methylglutaryl CoA synthase